MAGMTTASPSNLKEMGNVNSGDKRKDVLDRQNHSQFAREKNKKRSGSSHGNGVIEPSKLPIEATHNRKRTKLSHASKSRPKAQSKVSKKAQTNKPKKKQLSTLEFTWICTECREAECATSPDSPLLVCEGPCARPFHPPCAGLAALPPEDEEWWCNDCMDRRHQCASCHEYGVDGVDVHKCEKLNCGLFFHESCLNMYDVDIRVKVKVEEEEASGSGSDSSVEIDGNENRLGSMKIETNTDVDGSQNITTVPLFTCPAHHCWTCSGGVPPRMEDNDNPIAKEKDKKKIKKIQMNEAKNFVEKKDRLFRCLECPNSYHISCIPPHAAFHELALLCHEHAATSKLPYLNVKESFQGQVENETDELIQKLTKKRVEKIASKKMKTLHESNAFLFGLKGDAMVNFDEQVEQLWRLGKKSSIGFCTPCGIQKEVHAKPPVYTQIHTNQYKKHRPKRHPPSAECCDCKPKKDGITCDEHCLNRMLGIECIGNDSKNGQKNSYWNCNHGPECGNRQLSQRKFAKCKPKREQGKGWGLVAVNGVKKGNLIQEYAGEIIDEKTKRERLEDWTKHHPNDPNFYIMSLEPGWYIDAREKGSLSRFINHSCGPNCQLTPLNVGGHTRVAIIATRDIKPGEFLCYDYQFDTKDGDKFLCRCGAPGCRGSMKRGSNNTDKDEKVKTKKDIWTEAKSKLEKDKRFLEDLAKDQKTRLNQVGVCLPGEHGEGARAVASLPSNAFRAPGVCLWRNTVTGAGFASRYVRITSKKKRKPTKQQSTELLDVLSKINDKSTS